MSTIRPLATIAVLAALGVFLAFKINEGPAVALSDDWATPAGEEGAAPAWDDATGGTPSIETGASPTARSAPSWATSAAPEATEPPATPEFPALPTLPPSEAGRTAPVGTPPPVEGQPFGTELAADPSSASRFPTATQEQLQLPADIPQANYGDTPGEPPAKSTTSAVMPEPGITGRVPSLGASASNRPAAPPSPPGFDAAWQAVQGALERDELPRAHRILSQWREEPGLSPTQQQQVDALLAQLAGSVVYSTEHRLEPAHVVAAGETLATIAQRYQVPWQLLAKINGVATVDGVTPGQELKVVRGPFTADLDLEQGEMVLLLDNRYAGRFPVRVEGATPIEGSWRVGQKRLDPAAAESKVVLEGPTGEQFELSAAPSPSANTPGRISVASNDLADLFDILSVGSPVTIRR